MEDTAFRQKYEKYKRTVKCWEKEFKFRHDRIPSKYDIKEAPNEIRAAYKMYYKLKTSFLETTLNDALSDDGYDILEISQNFGLNESATDMPAALSTGISALLSGTMLNDTVDDSPTAKHFEAVETLQVNENAWDSSVSHKEKIVPMQAKPTKSNKLRASFTNKLIKTTSFSKRNPRKSLVSAQTADKTTTMTTPTSLEAVAQHALQETLPDLETILTQKAKEKEKEEAVVILNPLLISTTTTTTNDEVKETLNMQQLNTAWLERNTAKNDAAAVHVDIVEEKTTTYGLANLIVPAAAAAAATTTTTISNAKVAAVDSNSDAMVSGSESEAERQQERHIVKKRRLSMRTSQKELTPTKEIERELEVLSVQADEDFSLEKEQSVKPKRKLVKATRKRSKPATEQQREKAPRAKRKTTTTKAPKAKPVEQLEQDAVLPDVEELKCSLSLESGEITTVPRIAPAALKQADGLVQKYVQEATPSARTSQAAQINEKSASDRQKLAEKVAAGKLNENFVTINIQKKKFARGKKPMNYSKYKKTLWKQKKRAAALTGPEMDMRGCDGGVLTCFSCGQPGHFAQQCTQKGDKLLALTALDNVPEDSEFLTLEEAQRLAANKHAVSVPTNKLAHDVLEPMDEHEAEEDDLLCTDDELEHLDINAAVQDSLIDKYVGHKIPADFLAKAGLDANSYVASSKHSGCVTPLYKLNADGSLPKLTAEVTEALHMFGHTDFRKGQDRAIMRILCGQSTLVTLSTGSGKSLCYQLPAYLYSRQKGWITLVISPLVSLMEDQVTGVPHFLRVHCLHTNQTPVQRLKIIELIGQGQVDVLLVSPEAVVAGERSTGFGAILRQLPPIAFACIDEAHCVSQWSHNFRPSYLMICKVLRQNLGVKTLLGLTATATLATRTSIISHLGIPDGIAGVISDIPVPQNLYLSVSKDEHRDAALLALLQSERFAKLQSIIVYCTRRDECDRLATFLRTAFQVKFIP